MTLDDGTSAAPGWATGVPSTAPWRQYVTCGGCGRGMPWQEFVKHLRICQGEGRGPPGTETLPASSRMT